MATEEILIPDIGNFDSVDVIDILMNIGDAINHDDPLLTVESDKASMDIPAPFSGTVKEIKVKVGDKVKEGSLVAVVEKIKKSKKKLRKNQPQKMR
jgi:pyruvate dehydrogenase E2 component (dihydrolipoamide acetyltransferase)